MRELICGEKLTRNSVAFFLIKITVLLIFSAQSEIIDQGLPYRANLCSVKVTNSLKNDKNFALRKFRPTKFNTQ